MQAAALEGERVLVLEDEALIALDVRETLEREGAHVFLARSVPEALQRADHSSLSAGVLDLKIRSESVEPVCEALNRRMVPFVFHTGFAEPRKGRWATTPVVQKPANPAAIVGAVKFVLAPETREIIVKCQRGEDVERLARIDQAISDGEERVQRIRHCIARLADIGMDTSVSDLVLATMIELVQNMRAHREMSAHLALKLERR